MGNPLTLVPRLEFDQNFEPQFLDVTGHNFCYIQAILMILYQIEVLWIL